MSTNEQWHIERDAAELYERVVARHILGPWAPSLVETLGSLEVNACLISPAGPVW